MNLLYILESTDLCGGVKVIFNHVAALNKRGHLASILSPDPYPTWFNKNIPFSKLDIKLFHQIPSFNEIDFIIATCPLHLHHLYNYLYPDVSKLIHFVQGYEADCDEAEPFTDIITSAYSLNIPKVTVSERLSKRLSALYPEREFMTCGQGLEEDIFYPPAKLLSAVYSSLNSPYSSSSNICAKCGLDSTLDVHNDIVDTVILIGAFDISVKRVIDGLCAFKRASERIKNLKLIRISAVDTKLKEESFAGKIDEYHVSLTPCQVGELLRKRDAILISTSSQGEGFGLPPLEAMACGIPTVLTDIPSYRSFSSPTDYALFVKVGNIEQMANAIVELSENRALRYRIIKRGIEVASKYSYSKVVENLESCLLSLYNYK